MKKSKKMKKLKKAKKLKMKSLVAGQKRTRGPNKVKKTRGPNKVKKVKDIEMTDAPKRKRGRPRKEESVNTAPKKRGRKAKVETKREKMQTVAKMGKRKYKRAVEEMAMAKISKKMRRKGGINKGYGESHGDAVSVRTYSYETESTIAAGPDQAPVGIVIDKDGKVAGTTVSILDRIKNRLRENGYDWKESTFKVVEKTDKIWTVEFVDKKQGEITSFNDIIDAKREEDAQNNKEKKDPKLSKIELNQYIKKLKAHGHNPQEIRVVENKPDYFTIEFRDGTEGPMTKCSHARGWDLK